MSAPRERFHGAERLNLESVTTLISARSPSVMFDRGHTACLLSLVVVAALDFERGTLYGVYRFLEELGGRWFLPGPLGAVSSGHRQLPRQRQRGRIRRARLRRPRPAAVAAAQPRLVRVVRLQPPAQPSGVGETLRQGASRIDAYFAGRTAREMGMSDHQVALNPHNRGWSAYATYGRSVSLLPHDSFTGCQDQGCLAVTREDLPFTQRHSRLVWPFVIRVAEWIQQAHPEAFVINLAYASYTEPLRGTRQPSRQRRRRFCAPPSTPAPTTTSTPRATAS